MAMQVEDWIQRKVFSEELTEVLIRIALIALLLVMCLRIFAPFVNLVLWALILAIAVYPAHRVLANWLGRRQGLAATILVVAGLLLIGVPTVMLGGSFARHIHEAYTAFENNTITISPPGSTVADWPFVGKRVYSAWSSASDNLPAFFQKYQTQFRNIAKRGLIVTANTVGELLVFLGALFVAGIMMAYGESGCRALQRISNRLAGPARGPRLLSLSTATVRSVACGVIGVAFIQALLLGVGFILAGIPAAGVLALVVLLIGIVQLPALIISLPVVAYLWWAGDGSTTSNILYSIYLLVAGMADNVLKPLLLGRGVEAPMPVILLGALGGMASHGIIGLFVGAVLLAVGYQIFMDWIDHSRTGAVVEPGQQTMAKREK